MQDKGRSHSYASIHEYPRQCPRVRCKWTKWKQWRSLHSVINRWYLSTKTPLDSLSRFDHSPISGRRLHRDNVIAFTAICICFAYASRCKTPMQHHKHKHLPCCQLTEQEASTSFIYCTLFQMRFLILLYSCSSLLVKISPDIEITSCCPSATIAEPFVIKFTSKSYIRIYFDRLLYENWY